MKYWIIGAVALVSTFAVGLAVATLLGTKPITFSGGNIRSGFQTHYDSSDGQQLRYGCYEHISPAEAERYLNEELRIKYVRSPDGRLTKVGVVERTATLDGKGHQIGERVVLDDGELLWTEGSRFHQIGAPSVKYALLFEQARTWSWERCMNLAAFKDLSQ
jgi:hypothetical protein